MLCKKAANSKVWVGQTEKDLNPYVVRLNEGELTTVSKQTANYATESKALGDHL